MGVIKQVSCHLGGFTNCFCQLPFYKVNTKYISLSSPPQKFGLTRFDPSEIH